MPTDSESIYRKQHVIRMPQMFQVLRCYKCLVFQVHQTKKSNKFECKMCGENQSIKRHYGLGNGQECRKHVQKLNGIRGEMDESKYSENISTDDDDENENVSNKTPFVPTLHNKPSKWSEYLEKGVEKTETPDMDDKMYLDDTEVVLELPKKRRKQHQKNLPHPSKTTPEPEQLSDVHNTSYLHPELSFTGSVSTKQTVTIFKPPIKKEINQTSDSCKWADFGSELDNTYNLEQSECSVTQNNNVRNNNFVPLSINKNSKWAKFAEDAESNEENESQESNSQNNSQKDTHALFALCDDTDIDDYLNI